MYRKIIQPLLFCLNIERAHSTVLLLLRIIGAIPGGKWLLSLCFSIKHPALQREVFGLKFKNPVGLAAGFDTNGEIVNELAAIGFGFIEIGSVTPQPQAGNPRPRVFRLPKDQAIINRIGLANKGLDRVMAHLRQPHPNVIVGCNIGRNTTTPPDHAAGDYLKVFRNLYQYVDYFTININCDNGCQESTDHIIEHLERVLNPLFDFRRGQNQYRPILLKISPDLPNEIIDQITDLMTRSSLDGVMAVSGTISREGLETSTATLSKIGNGRISGAPLTKRAIEVVRRIHQRSKGCYPIIGCGGLMTPEDVQAMLAAGASLVQIYTGYIYEGPRFIKKINRALIADATASARAANKK
ncbi:MAG: quinone-dependent dihydroorotate dehydrogenase [Alistipes sp.]